ncbi:response regulator [Olleya aquimaris]|uniref:LytTR family two component transcriptional regulator n=1 Tax=Olleya aquimaris TaxID=639310 RepID=A0A327RN97_9FLAO|nr:response regulator [Olleya aquimaris]RAJ17775.1 LytTR family two component transcriptional regulator [Olleya aquimaris]
MKEHILIVENEAILYERLRSKLIKEHYSIDEFTPSVESAIAKINSKRPDLVLLDIHLEGKQTGLDLGELLSKTYNIPFIYVTQFDDDQTFYKGLSTNHEDFVVKTKPRLDIKELVRKIQTVLQRHLKPKNSNFKEGIMGLIYYLDNIKDLDKNTITRVPIQYKDIAFFTVKPFINEDNKEEALRANYLWFQTKNKDYFFLKTSLRDLQKSLPYHFVRINESYIVNIAPDMFDGRINGAKLSILNQEFIINSTYKEEVNSRLKHYYS